MTRIDNAIRFTIGECSLGKILVAMSDQGVRAISFGDEPETSTASSATIWSAAVWPANCSLVSDVSITPC